MQGNVFGSIGRAPVATPPIAAGGTVLLAATGGLPATVEARSADRDVTPANDGRLEGLRASIASCSTRRTRRAGSRWCTS